MVKDDGTAPAPEGCIYVCCACGKTSPTRYGFDAKNKNVGMPGWDESCMSNSRLFRIEDLERLPSGRVSGLHPDAQPIDE